MEKIYDVTALGEMLIDFAVNGESEQGNQLFEACPGGAPCNVLAMLNKLGRKTAFIGKVGDDQFGKLLRDTITNIGIEAKGLVMDQDIHTTLAFVHTFPDGDREFSFYRKPGADMMLKASEVAYDLIRQAEIFHFGTLSMTDETVREATIQAIALAKEQGLLISFDPNLRPPLWKSMDEAKVQIAYGLGQCDVLKISDNEIEFMTDTSDFDEGVQILMDQYPNIRLLNLTAGADGSYSYYQGKKVFVPSYLLGGTVDTTGAGDTFCGSVLNYLLEHDVDHLTEEQLIEMLRISNAAAYLVTTKKGAIRSMPNPDEVEKIVKSK